jgi:hypothetical protein
MHPSKRKGYGVLPFLDILPEVLSLVALDRRH